jgi:membrane carboxypeptidase/penicillin-binding protein
MTRLSKTVLKQKKKLISIILLITIVIAVIAYYSVEIIKARSYTKHELQNHLKPEALTLNLEDLSSKQLKILLMVEDPAFYTHHGIDLSTSGAGITTITQGLVKIFYFKKFKPGVAKIKQSLIAVFALDALVSKDDQLRLFINHCRLGKGTQGFESAARTYYHKSFKNLTEDEYISLVAMIIAPATFNVQQYPERNAERVARIKKLISGEYVPKGLFDLYYDKLDKETQKHLPPMSYFDKYYTK